MLIHWPVDGRLDHQIGLAAEKGRNLKDVGHFGHPVDLGRFVNVGQDRQIELGFDFLQHLQAVVEPRPGV